MNPPPRTTPPADDRELSRIPVEPLLTAEFDADPGAVYERLRRAHGPVAPVGLLGVPVWLVLDYRDVLDVLRGEGRWRRDVRHWRARAQGEVPADWPLLAGYEVRQTMFKDGAEHTAARRTLHTALAPFQNARTPQGWELRQAVSRYADQLVGLLAAESGTTGFADLGAQYTRPLLLMVTTKLFGCPVDLGDELVMDLWRMLDGGPDAGAATARALTAFTRLAAHRRERPGDDLTSYLLLADPELDDEQLGRELFMHAVYLNDITGNMVLNTLLEVLRGNATVRRSLSAGQLGETVNRTALANPPIANLCFRFAAQDVELGRYLIRAGDAVCASAAAAHQDLLALGASHMVGSTVSTRAHLGWGAGQHQCPTAARELGTLLVTTAVGRVFEHFTQLELSLPPDQLPWRSGAVVRGLRVLPVRYELDRYTIPSPPPSSGGAEPEGKGLLAALKRLMFGVKRDSYS